MKRALDAIDARNAKLEIGNISLHDLKTNYFFLFSDNHNESGYEAAINLASTLLPESVINLLRLALSLHLYAPKIQSFQQIASEYVESKSCFIFADINGQITCDEKELERLIQTASERFLDFEL